MENNNKIAISKKSSDTYTIKKLYEELYPHHNHLSPQPIKIKIKGYRIKFQLVTNLQLFLKFIEENIIIKKETTSFISIVVYIYKIIDSNLFRYNIDVIKVNKDITCTLKNSYKTQHNCCISVIIKSNGPKEHISNLKYLFETCEDTEFRDHFEFIDPSWKTINNLNTRVKINYDFKICGERVSYDFINQLASTLTRLELYLLDLPKISALVLPNLKQFTLNNTYVKSFEMNTFLDNNKNVTEVYFLEGAHIKSNNYQPLIDNKIIEFFHIVTIGESVFHNILAHNTTIEQFYVKNIFRSYINKRINIIKINDNFLVLNTPTFSPTIEEIETVIIPSKLIYINISIENLKDEDIELLFNKYPQNLLVAQIIRKTYNEEIRSQIKRQIKSNKTLQYILNKKTPLIKKFT